MSPVRSVAQFRAMQAAKHGHSTLDIPKKVGAEFVAATPSTKGLPQSAASPSTPKPPAPPAAPKPPRIGPSSAMESMTGLPMGKRKTRRGGRGKHNTKAAVPDANRRDGMTATAQTSTSASTPTMSSQDGSSVAGHAAIAHLATKAIEAGQPDVAKKHAFALVRALHKATSAKAPPMMTGQSGQSDSTDSVGV